MKIIKTSPPIVTLAHFGDQNDKAITSQQIKDNLKSFYENKHLILAAALDLEVYFDIIISNFFFGDENIHPLRKQLFKDLILSSEWCGFSSKRQLILQIVNQYEIFKGKEKNKYEKLLSKVMTYRNAFTHGSVNTDGNIIKICYFKGVPQEKEVNDQYLTEIEEDINECRRMTSFIIWPINENDND